MSPAGKCQKIPVRETWNKEKAPGSRRGGDEQRLEELPTNAWVRGSRKPDPATNPFRSDRKGPFDKAALHPSRDYRNAPKPAPIQSPTNDLKRSPRAPALFGAVPGSP